MSHGQLERRIGTRQTAHSVAPREATYAVITGDPDAPELGVRLEALRKQLRGEGVYAKGAGQYTEVAASPYVTGGDTRRAVAAVDRAIKDNPNLTAIVMLGGWAPFDPEAYKQAVAPKETELKAGAFVVSFDVSLPQLVLVKDGFVNGLIGQRPYHMGRKSIELLYEYATKLKRPERSGLHSGIEIVIRGNAERFIDEYQ